jgi:hypothetical protein
MEKEDFSNSIDRYFNKLVNYGGKGLIIGSITSYILISKWKPGALLGLGIGAGYCNRELFNIFNKFKQ